MVVEGWKPTHKNPINIGDDEKSCLKLIFYNEKNFVCVSQSQAVNFSAATRYTKLRIPPHLMQTLSFSEESFHSFPHYDHEAGCRNVFLLVEHV